jgi:RNA polymerase sigma-70 factor (ECF subfamily)
LPDLFAEPPFPEALLPAARAGDQAAFGALLELYRRYLALLARLRIGRLLQGKVDPADLVQETFLDAHRNFAGFAGTTEPEFVAWLRQILATRIADLMRRYVGAQARDVRLEAQTAADLDESSRGLSEMLIAPTSSPSLQAARREQAVLLADALDQLPAHYREVIILRQLEGLPFAEVGRRLGRSEDSVQKLWLRGLMLLRQSLQVLS